MASAAMEKARASLAGVRKRAQVEIAKREHTMFAVGASGLVGAMEARGNGLPSIAGIPGKLAWGVIAVAAADSVGGRAGRALQSAGDGLLCITAYDLGRTLGGVKVKGLDGDDGAVIEQILAE